MLAALVAATPVAGQEPGFRLTYRVRVLQRAGQDTQVIAVGSVRGPQDTDLRVSLHTDTAEVDALLEVFAEPDTVTLSGAFFGQHRAGRSRRGLPLWERDTYRRAARLPWGGSVRLYPFGPAGSHRRALWLEIGVSREFVGGETRPNEAVTIIDSSVALTLDAVVRPRRAAVRLTFVRGDSASAPKVLDMVPDAPGRQVTFVVGARRSLTIDVTLTRPDPPATGRDSALAIDADVICLRVLDRASAEPARSRCGRLNNVARRIPLAEGDTLVATFAWPAAR
jgi:hypothetical protein